MHHAETAQLSTIRLLDRFYGIFLFVCLVCLLIGVPFVFHRKAVSAAVAVLMTLAVLAVWRMSRRGQPEKSLKIFALGLWLVLIGLLYAGLPPVNLSSALAMAVMLAVVIHVRAGVVFGVAYLLAWLLYIVLQMFNLAPEPYFVGSRLTAWFIGAAAVWLVLLPIPELVGRLRRAASLHSAVIEAASDGILVISTQGRVSAYNQRFLALWGIPPEALKSGQDGDLLAFAQQRLVDPVQFQQQVQYLYEHPDQDSIDTLRFTDGRIVERHSHPQRLDGQVVGRVWSFRDVTGSALVQEALRKGKEQFEAILNATTESIFLVNPQGAILAINATAAKRLKLEPAQLVGQSAFDYFPPEVAASRRAALSEVFQTGHVINTEDARGERYFSLNYYPVQEEHGKVEAVVVFALDISERKRAERAALSLAKRNQLLMQTATEGIHILDPAGHLIEFNGAFARMLGYEPQELAHMHVAQWDANWSNELLRIKLDELIQNGGEFETVHRRKDGTLLEVEVHTSSVVLDGQTYLYAASRDVTARQNARREIERLAQRNKLLLDSVGEGIFDVDLEGRTTFCNPAALAMLGLAEAQMLGQDQHALFHHHRPDGNLYPHEQCPVYQVLQDGKRRRVESEWFWRQDGTGFHVSMIVTPIMEGGERRGVVVVFQDITERKRVEAEIHRLAFHDALTKLPNRRLLNDRLEQLMAACKRSNLYGAVLFLDMDNFKPLNDAQGHGAGDVLLIEVARRITACVRETDTVARFGGDEFVVMLGKLDADPDAARLHASRIAEKIRDALAQAYELTVAQSDGSDRSVHHTCTASIGIALFAGQIALAEEVLKQADMAMYQAKDAGRNAVSFYESEFT